MNFVLILVSISLVVSGAKAESQKLDSRFIYFNTLFANVFNDTEEIKLSKNETNQTWYNQARALGDASKKQVRLMASGEQLCILKHMARLCWSPIIEGKKVGVLFKNEKAQMAFYPTNINDRKLALKEFMEFVSPSKRKSSHLFWLLTEAQANDQGLAKDVEINGWYLNSFEKTFPGLVVASASGWKYLADHPDKTSIDNFAKSFQRRMSAIYLTQADEKSVYGTVRCQPIKYEFVRGNGQKTVLAMNKDNSFNYDIFAPSAKKGTPPIHSYILRFGKINANQTVGFPFTSAGRYTHHLEGEVIEVRACEPGSQKDCRDNIDFSYAPDYPRAPSQNYLKNAVAFSDMNENSELLKISEGQNLIARKDSDDGNSSTKAFIELGRRFRTKTEEIQTQMLHMAEVKMACSNPEVRAALTAKGFKFSDDAAAKAPDAVN